MSIFKRITSLLHKHVEPKIVKFFLFSLLDTFVGMLAMLLYGIFTHTYGPVWIRNQYFGLWLSTLIFYIGLQSIYIEIKRINNKFILIYDLIYFALFAMVSFLMIIFYGMSKRIDAIIWSIYICAVCLTNVYVLYVRKSNLNQVDTTQQTQSRLLSCLIMTLRIGNVILRFIFLLIGCLLLAGALIEGTGNAKYPARGKFTNVDYAQGKTIKVHYLCDGLNEFKNESVIMFEGSASHGLLDYLSLQKLLKANKRRSCIWDKPGNGYSDYLYTDFDDYIHMYHSMLSSFGEQKPFDLVGWGGGGSLIYHYAYQHPDMVKSLTFLDVAPNDIEFKIPALLKNWTQSQLDEYKRQELASRLSLVKVINGLGVPLGLMSLFYPPTKTFVSELIDEATWYFLTEKTWITQEYFIKLMQRNETTTDYFETLKIDQSIPVNVLMTHKSDEQIVEEVCERKKYAPNSSECVYEINSNRISISERAKLVNLSTGGGKLVNCTMNECDLGFYVQLGANYTVYNLLNTFNL
jgi:pimeloyl-ACP methyl ester carboxylesterase